MSPRSKSYDRPKNLKKAGRDLYVYLKPYIVPLVIALLFGIASALLAIFVPGLVGAMSNLISEAVEGQGTIDMVQMTAMGIVALGLIVLSAVLSLFTTLIFNRMTLRMSRCLRDDLERKINLVPLSYYSQNAYGDVLSRFTNDVNLIVDSVNNSLSPIVTGVFQFVGCVVMMFVTEWRMAITAVAASLIGIVLTFVIVGRSQKYFVAKQEALGDLNGYIEEMYGGHDVVKVSGADQQVKEEFKAYNRREMKANFLAQVLSGLMPVINTFVGNFSYVAVCVVGAIGVSQGWLTFGVISSFILFARLFTSPLSSISQGLAQMQSCLAASERVFSFLAEGELPNEEGKTAQIPVIKGEVDFEHVRFAYDDEPDKIVISDFSCHVKPGQKVAIVGPTGAGKTTLVNLLMRFYELRGGSIKIDGVDTSTMKRESVHDLFGMVLQDTWLFEGTVRENLVFNKTGVSDDDIMKAARACGIDSFIASLPRGLDTVLDDNTSISAGQKQLFTIARAMIQNNPMLILDEATSNVDTRTEILIQVAMDQLTSGRTSFVIAHRLSTIKNADLILVISHGDIVEQGNHAELLAKNGFYANLYNSQFDENAGDGSIDSIIKEKNLAKAS